MQVAAIGVQMIEGAARQIVATDGIRRQNRAEFRHFPQHMRDEGVGVRTRIDR